MSVIFEKVSFEYDEGTPFRQQALNGINLRIEPGSFTAIAGRTGSGKSTLLQMFGGLIQPSKGSVKVFDNVLQAGAKLSKLRELRRRVGLVFQFPEHQLFEETVEKDLCFGPLNFGLTPDEAKQQAAAALRQVGLPEELLGRSPLQLSGGQMRKVAIASVLAMDPDLLVLDEPGASLDPASRVELTELLLRLCREQGKTVVIVTHRIDELLPYADSWILMKDGSCLFQGTAGEMAGQLPALENAGLQMPECMHWWHWLARRFALLGEPPIPPVFNPAGLAELTAKLLEAEKAFEARNNADKAIPAFGGAVG